MIYALNDILSFTLFPHLLNLVGETGSSTRDTLPSVSALGAVMFVVVALLSSSKLFSNLTDDVEGGPNLTPGGDDSPSGEGPENKWIERAKKVAQAAGYTLATAVTLSIGSWILTGDAFAWVGVVATVGRKALEALSLIHYDPKGIAEYVDKSWDVLYPQFTSVTQLLRVVEWFNPPPSVFRLIVEEVRQIDKETIIRAVLAHYPKGAHESEIAAAVEVAIKAEVETIILSHLTK